MQLFSDIATDKYGNALSGKQITVKLNGSTATIYSDNGATTQTNPITTNSNGIFSFYAADGTYTFWVDGTQVGQATLFDVNSYSDIVNVKQYEAAGDGETDDTSAFSFCRRRWVAGHHPTGRVLPEQHAYGR